MFLFSFPIVVCGAKASMLHRMQGEAGGYGYSIIDRLVPWGYIFFFLNVVFFYPFIGLFMGFGLFWLFLFSPFPFLVYLLLKIPNTSTSCLLALFSSFFFFFIMKSGTKYIKCMCLHFHLF
ncbi:hypothetical protein DFH27DRAFT_110523 [Peziza echinospora]|nr:hypothetical protein DFH27DRAFT_110523 [Peziza echinospora]